MSSSRGTAENQNERTYQFLTDPNLDLWRGPSSVDRRHILSIGARTEIPKTGGATLSTTVRYMSGAPFTIFNSAIDVNRNGELDDPVPAGTYGGTALNAMQHVKFDGARNGARGPDYFQADVRAGWRRPIARGNALEIFLDIYNITNRANFVNPVDANRDARVPASFLVLTNFYGGGGFPRQATELKQFSGAHQLACPSENEVYAAETSDWRVQKLILRPQTQTSGSSR